MDIPAKLDIETTFGAMFFGAVVSAWYVHFYATVGSDFTSHMDSESVFGASTMQAYLYYHRFQRDPRYLKVAVSCQKISACQGRAHFSVVRLPYCGTHYSSANSTPRLLSQCRV